MDLEFQIVEPDEYHRNHFVVVAVFESGEELEVIGFKNRRDAVIIADTAYGPAEWTWSSGLIETAVDQEAGGTCPGGTARVKVYN